MAKKKCPTDPIRRTNAEIDAAVRVLLDAEYLLNGRDQELVLLYSPKHRGVYLVPEVITEEMAEDRKSLIGKIEYMICDGPRGDRSYGSSTYNLKDAIAYFNEVCEWGWKGKSKVKTPA